MFAGTLAAKRGDAPLALTWDPVERTGEPVRCPRCDRLTYEVGVHRGRRHCLSAVPRGRRSVPLKNRLGALIVPARHGRPRDRLIPHRREVRGFVYDVRAGRLRSVK